MPPQGDKLVTKYIYPHKSLIKYVREKPLLDRSREKLNMRKRELESRRSKHPGRILSSKDEKKLSDIEIELSKIKSRQGTLSDDKSKLLDNIIFPAMANLQFFFESVSTIPELSNFESDITDLFGITRHRPRADNYAFMFKELILGMINVTNGEDDFRLKLVHELQDIILRKLYGSKILDSPKATNVIFGDIGRVLAWTEMLSARIPDRYDLSKLGPRYDKEKLDKLSGGEQKQYIDKIDKETLESFEKYAQENIPHRSFKPSLRLLFFKLL
jgi:hypothetical protein